MPRRGKRKKFLIHLTIILFYKLSKQRISQHHQVYQESQHHAYAFLGIFYLSQLNRYNINASCHKKKHFLKHYNTLYSYLIELDALVMFHNPFSAVALQYSPLLQLWRLLFYSVNISKCLHHLILLDNVLVAQKVISLQPPRLCHF